MKPKELPRTMLMKDIDANEETAFRTKRKQKYLLTPWLWYTNTHKKEI